MLRTLKHEDDFVRLLCSSVWLLWRTSGSFRWAWIASANRVGSEFEVGWPTSEEEVQKKKSLPKWATKSLLTAVLEVWLLSILHCRFSAKSVANFCLFAGDAETIPGVSRNEDVSTGVETDGQLRERHIVVTGNLVPLAGGPSKTSPRLSTVEVGAGSCWSRCLMTILLVFKLGIS